MYIVLELGGDVIQLSGDSHWPQRLSQLPADVPLTPLTPEVGSKKVKHLLLLSLH